MVAVWDRFVVILTAYFDDSGTHAGSDAVAVAGYVSTPEKWAEFESEWRRALQDFGLSFFHMTDFANGAKAYAHWQRTTKQMRLARLVEIINAHVIGSVGTVIPTALFNRLFSAKAKAHCGGSYGLAATANFVEVARIVRALNERGPWDAWIAYVFESGTLGAGQVLKSFQYNKNDPKQEEELRLLSLRFEDKRQLAPLQAADILAYELYRQLPKQLGADPRPPRQFNLERLSIPDRDWGRFDEDELKKWSEIIEIAADLAATHGWPRKRLPDDRVPSPEGRLSSPNFQR